MAMGKLVQIGAKLMPAEEVSHSQLENLSEQQRITLHRELEQDNI